MTASIPLIVRIALAQDWGKAFEIVFIDTFKIAARDMGQPADTVSIEMGKPPADWPERRAACRRLARRFVEDYGNRAMAAAWAMLATNPAPQPTRTGDDEAMIGIALSGLARAIVDKPQLVDDQAFFQALCGWRFVELVGIAGPPDPITAAQAVGATITMDRDDMVAWASSRARL